MREIYRGNGFVITTNDSGEIFVALEDRPSEALRISGRRSSMTTSYSNTGIIIMPSGSKMLSFVLPPIHN